MIEAKRFSETSVLTKVRRRPIPEGSILHTHRRENLKSYIVVYTIQGGEERDCSSEAPIAVGDPWLKRGPKL
jgi:hypothetical protein